MEDIDIHILMRSNFEQNVAPETRRTVHFAALDQALKFEPGTCAKHLEAAVKGTLFSVAERGVTVATIYRSKPFVRDYVPHGG